MLHKPWLLGLTLIPLAILPARLIQEAGGEEPFRWILMLIVIFAVAKVFGFVAHIGVPAVLGELMAGIVMAALGYLGLEIMIEIRDSELIAILAEFGAILLLFSVGLESNVEQVKSVGMRAALVAIVGVITPLCVGFYLNKLLFPDLSFAGNLFVASALVATSVGITAAVMKDLGVMHTPEAQTTIYAGVIDDVLGLLVLAAVSALVSSGEMSAESLIIIAFKAVIFLVAAWVLAAPVASMLSQLFSVIHPGTGMKLVMAVVIMLLFAYGATLMGLEPIIGAFAAGLMLDPVHFKRFHIQELAFVLHKHQFKDPTDQAFVNQHLHEAREGHVEELVQGLGAIFIPVFFAYIGLQIEIGSLLHWHIYPIALLFSIVAILTKVASMVAAEGSLRNKLQVGIGMVPRGEVGLVFLSVGATLGVLSAEVFSVLLITIIVTTLAGPFMLKWVYPKNQELTVQTALVPAD